MTQKRRGKAPILAVLLGLAFAAACGSSGVVGGNCAPGYIICDGQCVDGRNEDNHCGTCSNVCEQGVKCGSSTCGGSTAGASSGGNSGKSGDSGTSGDANMPNGEAGEGGEGGEAGSGASNTGGTGGSAGGGTGANSGFTSGGDAGQGGGNGCTPPFDQPTACGDCATACPAAKPLCAPDGIGGFECVPMCVAPLQACNGKCVDYNIDPLNCGSCGNVCLSGICQGGMCVGAQTGDVVLVCMDYQTPAVNSAYNTLLGNAALSQNGTQVRILAYTEFVSPAARAKVDQHITFAAPSRNKVVTFAALSKYTSATATLNITNYDVFLIYDQDTAPAGQMATVGAAWQASSVLESFAAAGGTIVALSGGTGEMGEFLTSSALLDVSAQTVVPVNTFLYNRNPLDAVGKNVISPFSAPSRSCTFTTSATPDAKTVFVVRTAANDTSPPVVVHRGIY